MDYITTTQLRTQTKQLVNQLRAGKKIALIHRSEQVGTIQADIGEPAAQIPKKTDRKILISLIKSLKLPQLTDSQRQQNYQQSLSQKHG